MTQRTLFLGGNGHCAARLRPARAAIVEHAVPLALIDMRYPGFERRACAPDFDAFLDAIAETVDRERPDLIYGTGIGGFFALALRSRGDLAGTPILLHGAVLWGLEQRLFARSMRGPLPHLLHLALRTPLARRRFRKKHLPAGIDPELELAFFEGYGNCRAFPDFFRWMRSPLLRTLEARFRSNPAALADIEVWWSGRDGVVGLEELRVTERALGVEFPTRQFADWAHYPMLEDPLGWVQELSRALA